MSQSCIIEELDQEQPASSGAATLSRASSNESYRSAGSDQAPAEQAEDSASAAKVPQEPKADGEDGHATEDFAEPAELTADELEALERAEQLKHAGNDLYKKVLYKEALEAYAEAQETAPDGAKQQRAVYFANSAAVRLKMQDWAAAAKAASAALTLEPAEGVLIKALLRRCEAYERLDDLDHALADAEKVAQAQPSNASAAAIVKRLTPVVAERRQKLQDEMLGKLKELGNTVLGKFGMSLDNFKAVKDPTTGSYSINFQQ